MSNAMPATTGKSIPVAVIILSTLVWGGGYAIEGGYLILVWADFLPGQPNDLSERIIFALEPGITYLAVFGVLFLVFGIMALLGALGLLWRRQWGRFLMLTIAVLAISLGLCSLNLGPSIPDTTNVPLGVAQILYGVLALAILSMNRVEPLGIYILRLLNILVGLPVVLFLSLWLPEFVRGFFEGTSRGDAGSRFLALAVFSGSVAGWLILATGVSLLNPRLRRFMTAVGLMIAAASAEVAMAALALLGAFLGHSREGLREGWLLLFFFPFALVLLFLTASGVWYLRRIDTRRALEAEQEHRQGSPRQVAARNRPSD